MPELNAFSASINRAAFASSFAKIYHIAYMAASTPDQL